MNTNPDEVTLALWLDDELDGEDRARVESWAVAYPDQLAAREEIRSYRKELQSLVPASVEPPFADFFNSRVAQGIRDQAPREAAAPVEAKSAFWKSWFLPVAACAGMAMAFWVGMQTSPGEQRIAKVPAGEKPVEPTVYIPEGGVNAEWFSSKGASATVIVLQGVNAIPDSTDFSETVYVPMERESDSTAESQEKQPGEVRK